MTMVKLNSWEDFLSLPVNKWNIPEPPADQVREDALDKQGLDLIIVPGVGFDVEGNRIGHGRGYVSCVCIIIHCREVHNTHPLHPFI